MMRVHALFLLLLAGYSFVVDCQVCQANQAGPNCDPVCLQRGNLPAQPDPGGDGDIVAYSRQTACNANMTLQIDSHCGIVTIQIDSPGNSPTLTLYDSQTGLLITPIDTSSGQNFIARYKIDPGTYTIVPAANGRLCLIIAQAVSDMSVRIGFVNGDTQSLYSDTPSRDMTASQAAYILMHAYNLPKPGAITRITIYVNGNQNFGVATGIRYRCAYDVFATRSYPTCSLNNDYRYLIEGYDENGYKFTRVDTFHCIAAPPPTTSMPPTTTTVNSCLNGGTLVALRECLCSQFYTGSRCETMMCYNGGTLAGNNTCLCDLGYSGTFCQDVKCMESPKVGFNTNFRTLTFVLYSDEYLFNVAAQILGAINSIKASFTQNDPEYFSNFVLTTYNKLGIYTVSFGTFDDLYNGITALFNGPLIDTSCQQPIMAALQSTITQNEYSSFSPIFVFTYGVANDYQLELSVTETLSFIRATVNFIHTPQAALGCPSDPLNPTVAVMSRIASFSQGIVAPFNDYQQNALQRFVNIIALTTYKTDTVFTGDYNNLMNLPDHLPFFVDSQTLNLIFVAVGSNLSLSVYLSTGSTYRPPSIYAYESVNIWQTTGTLPVGPYQLELSGNAGPCSFRVYARSNLDLFLAISNDLTQDFDSPLPIWQVPSHMVAHVNNHNYDNPDALYAELHVFTQDSSDKQQALYLSSGAFRSQCQYELYFGSLACPIPNQMFYITMHAYDNNGNAFQRMTTGYCAPGRATQQPPSQCLNGGVQLPSNSSLCICPPYFNGNRCETSVCLNGGSSLGSKCLCPPGTSGLHCEIPTCYQYNSGAVFSVNGRSLVIAIEIKILMLQAINNLKNQVSSLIREVNDQNPNWIQQYVLITFTDASADLVISTPDPSRFMQAVINIQPYLGEFIRCQALISQALQLALNNTLPQGMVFVFTRSSIYLQSSDDATIPYTMIDQTQAQVNFIITSPRPCQDAFQSNVTTLMTMWAQYSGGVAMVASNNDVAQWISYIPTQYRSGLVIEAFFGDCSRQNQTVYFPIEARTTAFVFTVTGNYPTISLYQPDGILSTNYYSILNSNQYGQIEAVLQKCDTFFNANENNCYLAQTQMRNWEDARNYCHSRGASLVDVLDLKKQQYLSNFVSGTDYWIGLNDIMREGTFIWDDVSGSYRPQNGYSNWAPGEPAPDPGHIRNCVSVRHSQPGDLGAWYTDDCNKAYAFICQKHPYNNTFEPDPASNVFVPPGLWTATVQTQQGSCFLQVRSQSSLQVYPGYTLDLHSDMPMTAPIFNINARNRVMAHLTSQAKLEFAHMYRPNLTLAGTSVFSPRAQCAYEWISDPITCINNAFSMMTIGVDDLGYPFQRMNAIVCQNTALGCLNNGYFDGTQCQCPKYWTGTLCQTAVCVNGGTNNGNTSGDGTACNCPPSYSGQFCEQIICPQPSPPNFDYGSRSLVLIIDLTPGFSPFLNDFKRGLSAFLTAVTTGMRQGWFRNYIFIPMYGAPAGQPTGSLGEIIVSTSIPEFVAAVNNTQPLLGGCPLPIYSAISTALSLPNMADNSIIYVISTSLAQDVTSEAAILVAIQQTRALINFVLPGDGVNYNCGTLSNSNANVVSYQKLTLFSGGALFFPARNDFMLFLQVYTSTLYGGSIITEGYQASCGQMQLIIPVDYGMSEIVILVRASSVTLSIAKPDGTPVTPTSLFPESTGTYVGYIVIALSDLAAHGYWIMNITTGPSPIPCVVQVKALSNVQVFYQFVQGQGALNMDGGSPAPSPLTNDNYIILHANGVHPAMPGRLTFVEFFDLQLQQTVITMPLVRRTSCSYEYISATPFACPGKSFGIAVNGLDDTLLPFKRLYFVQCSDTTMQSTTTTQAPPTPLNMIDADFIFALDVSGVVPLIDFQVMKVFIENFVTNCTVGPQNSQFAILTYNSAGVSNSSFLLNAYSTQRDLLLAIFNLPFSSNQDPQTDLMGTLNYTLNNALNVASGYRNGQAYVIIMASSATLTSDINPTLVLGLNQVTTPFAFNINGSQQVSLYLQEIVADSQNAISTLTTSTDLLTNAAISQKFTQYVQTKYQGSLTTPSGPLCRQPYIQQESCGMTDIVLVLDASTSMSAQTFTDLKCFLTRYFASKVIGPAGVQVAAIVYAGGAFLKWDTAQSVNLSTVQTAIESLALLQTSEDPDNSRQNITGALTMVQSSVTTRPSASKFIVLISSNQYTGAVPTAIASQLRASFTILGISVDPTGSNWGLLDLLSGDAQNALHIESSDQIGYQAGNSFGQFLKQFVCS